jgi:hypothetical protein
LAVAADKPTVEKKAKGKDQVVETKSQKARGDAPDPNVKSKVDGVNAPDAQIKLPPSKGGEAQRGICQAHFDNRTPWFLQCFVDGDYRGTVPPGGDLWPAAGSGDTVLYARALFTDGSVRTWGPKTVYIPAGSTFNWLLLP